MSLQINHENIEIHEIHENLKTLFRLIPPLSVFVFGMCAMNSHENKLSVTSFHTFLPSY